LKLGFEYAELSHGTRISLMPASSKPSGREMKISTSANFCPLPMGGIIPLPTLPFTAEWRERESRSSTRSDARSRRASKPARGAAPGQRRAEDYSGKLKEMLGRGEKLGFLSYKR
jgi:hypothetical protein